MKINKGQLAAILIVVLSLGLIIYQATRSQSSVTFYTPEEVYKNPSHFKGKIFRVSGLVLKGTKIWNAQTSELNFKITDLNGHDFFVFYKGLPPDLFKEGQGVVVEGALAENWDKRLINADLLMVKHSEVYDTKQDHARMREAKLLDSMLKAEGKIQ
jgi:cytochrome c-type biogenesis protein CcmE